MFEKIENKEIHENVMEMCEEKYLNYYVKEFELIFPLLFNGKVSQKTKS
jgi:hypothetical protein